MILHQALKVALVSVLFPTGALSQIKQGYELLMANMAVNADIWSDECEILSADYGFDGLIGVDGNNQLLADVRAAGGGWGNVTCDLNQLLDFQVINRVVGTGGLGAAFGNPDFRNGDGYPIVFSCPVLTETVSVDDFEVVMNTGEVLKPEGVSCAPNQDLNERNTIVLVSAAFGNRVLPWESGARFPTKVRIVNDGTPLMLLGPDGPVNGVGLEKTTDRHSLIYGPTFIKAKLNKMEDVTIGDEPLAPNPLQFNSCGVLYGEAAKYRIRLLANNGYTRDGITGNRPNEFSKFFQIATSDNQLLTRSGITYSTPSGSIQILGLAELGPACITPIGPVCDACYMEDLDNQIDICLSGDEAAVATITHVYTPSGGDYLPFYNPGGPGIDPDPDTVYTAKSTFITTEVINALDDPMTVSLCSSLYEPAGECDNTEGNYICCPPLVCHETEQVCVTPGHVNSPTNTVPSAKPSFSPSDHPLANTSNKPAGQPSANPSNKPLGQPSVTHSPATEPPATDPPALAFVPTGTEPPATVPQETDPLATDSPATDPPATDFPGTKPPATDPQSTFMTVSLCSSLFEPAGECDNAEGNYVCCPTLVCHATEQVCVMPGNEYSTIPTPKILRKAKKNEDSLIPTPKILRKRAKNHNKKKVE